MGENLSVVVKPADGDDDPAEDPTDEGNKADAINLPGDDLDDNDPEGDDLDGDNEGDEEDSDEFEARMWQYDAIHVRFLKNGHPSYF